MSGINYDLKKIKGLIFDVDGVLSPSTIPMGYDGMPRRMVNVKDGYALQLAVKCGFRIAIITGGRSESVPRRLNALGITDIYQNCGSKIAKFELWIKENGLMSDEVMYMGDDIPDIECLRMAGLSCCPHDAAPEVLQTCSYISRFPGGYGCVRDVVEQIIKANNLWMSDDSAFGW